MTTIYDVSPNDLIAAAALKLKSMPELKAPEWAVYVKTGMHKERPPMNPDWWHFRAAAVLRACAKLGPIGVSKLRTKYGGKKNRGHKPEATFKGSGNIIRKVLQQLEAAALVKQATVGKHKGRVVTPQGQALLDSCAAGIAKSQGAKQKAAQPAAAAA